MLGLLGQPFPATWDQGHTAIPSLSLFWCSFQELYELTYQIACAMVCVVMYGGTSQGFLVSILELRT